jgi:transposase
MVHVMPDPQGQELSEGLRGEIVGMRKVKTSFAEIGRILQLDESTTRKVWKRYQETGSYASAPREGRPPILTDSDTRHIVRHVGSLRFPGHENRGCG